MELLHSNAHLPDAVFADAFKSDEYTVRLLAVGHPECPQDLLVAAVTDRSSAVRRRASRKLPSAAVQWIKENPGEFPPSELWDWEFRVRHVRPEQEPSHALYLVDQFARSVRTLETARPTEFEEVVTAVLSFFPEYGKLWHVGGPGDRGADIAGVQTVVQCKRWNVKVGTSLIYDLRRTLRKWGAEKAVLVSLSGFTKPAVAIAAAASVQLIDGEELVRMGRSVLSQQHWEKADRR